MTAPSWSFLERWRAPGTWTRAAGLVAAARRYVAAERDALEPVFQAWDRALAKQGGELSRRDWRSFRPIHASRASDWTDWLGHLLETSRTGLLAQRLFGTAADAPERFATPTVTAIPRERPGLAIAWDRGEIVIVTPDGDLWARAARALRECLWKQQEDAVWLASAVTLCGNVEQRLLGRPVTSGPAELSRDSLERLRAHARALEEWAR